MQDNEKKSKIKLNKITKIIQVNMYLPSLS